MKQLFIIALGLLILSTSYSCKRKGCTYDTATNHSSKAKKDDGSCEFESRVSFWFNQSTSNFLVSYGVTTLHIYVDDQAVGEINVSDWKIGADCGGNNLTIPTNYTETETKVYQYEARSQTGTLHFEGTFTASPNECLSVELKW
ncbi:MAG: hypothetical protein K0S23_2877 [Fluviicola sp.]|jgi:hypothetical protein|uniref:hypothetical protein n=1 Tax=Fluviicola sp. TaxID=1917219 RepID=UPI002601C555|nr:hypothetical protein [Fluviicola sp.]MDF3028570.1 hypothetical protein [Fluviicola sp.]